MHIVKISLERVKSLSSFSWQLQPGEAHAGWHVFLGDNGAGKSTLLRSVAMAMLDHSHVSSAAILGIVSDGSDSAKISINAQLNNLWDETLGGQCLEVNEFISKLTITNFHGVHAFYFNDKRPSEMTAKGYFSASFGPQRRFTGASRESEQLAKSMPRLARHLSIFREDVAFTETLQWLKDLDYRQLDDIKRGITVSPFEKFLRALRSFINQDGFLPNGAKLEEIGPDGVFFCDPNGVKMDINDLSDGFRSILSLTIELIRQLSLEFGFERIFSLDQRQVMPHGVVLIDEIDAHLHPKWQRAIGPWLVEHFPNIQFLVTTHSPLVCQAAEHGTVTRLPQPGAEDQGGRISGIALHRLLYGNILEAMSSGAFGNDVGRSEVAKAMYSELAQLNVKARRQTLDASEQARQLALREIFALSPEVE